MLLTLRRSFPSVPTFPAWQEALQQLLPVVVVVADVVAVAPWASAVLLALVVVAEALAAHLHSPLAVAGKSTGASHSQTEQMLTRRAATVEVTVAAAEATLLTNEPTFLSSKPLLTVSYCSRRHYKPSPSDYTIRHMIRPIQT